MFLCLADVTTTCSHDAEQLANSLIMKQQFECVCACGLTHHLVAMETGA